MGSVSVIESIKFGFNKSFKKFFFLFGSMLVTIGMWLAGLVIGLLISIPFFIPIFRGLSKIKESIGELFAIKGAGMPPAEAGEKIKLIFEKIAIIFSDVYSSYPTGIILAILGVLVVFFVFFYIQMMLGLGWIKIGLDISSVGASSMKQLFVKPHLVMRGLFLSMFIIFIVGAPFAIAGIMYLVHPILGLIMSIAAVFLMIYLTLKTAYSFIFLVDKDIGLIDAIKHSFMLKGGPINAFLLWLLMVTIFIVLGVILRFIASLIRVPALFMLLRGLLQFIFSMMNFIAFTHLYRALTRSVQ